MEYRKADNRIYIRLDKDGEIIASLAAVCLKEKIGSAVFSGIGACDYVIVGTYVGEKHEYLRHPVKGMLEMTSLNGNVTTMKDGSLHTHAHAMFAYLDGEDMKSVGGHLLTARICYTGEIIMEPMAGPVIGRKHDPRTGIEIWDV